MDAALQENHEIVGGTLSKAAAARYLTIYLGDPSANTWEGQIDDLWTRLNRKGQADQMKQILSCAILLPAFDAQDLSQPEILLHKCQFYRQFNDRDWFRELQAVVARDIEISGWRAQALSLGVIKPFDLAPYTRQAYNWLYSHAEESGAVTEASKEDIRRRMANMVYAYGGAVICSVYHKEQDKQVKKIVNWRTGYFFERLIYRVYEPDQVIKIKTEELHKTNAKLVKRIATN